MVIITTAVSLLLCSTSSVQALSFDRRHFLSTAVIPAATIDLPISSVSTRTALGVDDRSSVGLPSMPENVEITDKVFMDVRIARSDGSSYIRDDLPDTFENRVIFQRINIGLYGKITPKHTARFLSYIDIPNDYDIDNPYPSYSRSTFPALDQGSGLLSAGVISGLRVASLDGMGGALTYGNRILPADLWIENNNSGGIKTSSAGPCISHSTKGLLTHKNLNLLPDFGITTRSQPDLDSTQTVFGEVLWDMDTLKFFRDLEDIPTYSVERPASYDDFNTGTVAKTVFNAQREFFRGAAKSFGDDRVGKLYDGKLLRRMEVLKVGRV